MRWPAYSNMMDLELELAIQNISTQSNRIVRP